VWSAAAGALALIGLVALCRQWTGVCYGGQQGASGVLIGERPAAVLIGRGGQEHIF